MIVSETVPFLKSVSVAVVKCTSVTVAVHISFGHELNRVVGELVATIETLATPQDTEPLLRSAARSPSRKEARNANP